jgi:hypothetical protein
VKDFGPAALSDASFAALRKLDPKKLPLVKGKPRIGACVTGTGKFVAIGLNYIDHAKETGSPIPEHPIVFYKTTNCIQGPNDPVMQPKGSTQLDYEVELGIVIGKRARNVDEKSALKYVAGYCLMNDVSEREFQIKKGGGQWSKGKGCGTFGPIGPDGDARESRTCRSWDVVRRQRHAAPDWQHEHDDLRRRQARVGYVAVHDARAGRPHHDRHAAGRRARHEAAQMAPAGRRRDTRHRRPRHADAEGRSVQGPQVAVAADDRAPVNRRSFFALGGLAAARRRRAQSVTRA